MASTRSYSGSPRLMTPAVAFTDNVLVPAFPLFVVIMMTPLAPRDPYNAVVEASFSTEMDSISSGLMLGIAPSKGTPSITINAVFDADTEPKPRSLNDGSSPGAPPATVDW